MTITIVKRRKINPLFVLLYTILVAHGLDLPCVHSPILRSIRAFHSFGTNEALGKDWFTFTSMHRSQ